MIVFALLSVFGVELLQFWNYNRFVGIIYEREKVDWSEIDCLIQGKA